MSRDCIEKINIVEETKDITYSLSKPQLLNLKRNIKNIMIDIVPAYGKDAKAIRAHIDSIDILIDLYLARFNDTDG